MHSIMTRSQPLPSSSAQSHRMPRKSSSFLSLRHEGELFESSIPSNFSPTHSPPDDFDVFQSSTAPSKFFSRREARFPSSRSPSLESQAISDHSFRGKATASVATTGSYAFPRTEDIDVPILTPKPYSRTRSRTGPSSRTTNWIDRHPGQRISNTSTINTETPPDTPVDNASFEDFNVLVAAPISGVEMMDALVDNLNGGDEVVNFSNRSRFGIPGHHPLYQPPLPTPPPGVVLGGGKVRRPKKSSKPSRAQYSDDEDGSEVSPTTPKRRRPRQPSARSVSNTTITSLSSSVASPKLFEPETTIEKRNEPKLRPQTAPSTPDKRKSLAPSISDIIRAHAPLEGQSRARVQVTRTPSHSRSVGHTAVRDGSIPDALMLEEDAELLSRSSIDSIADEVQRTLRHQNNMRPAPPSSFYRRYSTISDTASITSPRSDGGGAASIYSSSIASSQPPLSPFDTSFISSLTKPSTPSQAVAQYLRSTRLTTLLKLTRSPHASHDNPLTVSLSDLGCQSGFPVLVFLGLGCVRHIMGLYDEMADCLGLRLITIDRWGLGRTEPRAKSAKGIMQWASVVEEVLDLLHIKQCAVMAHSAGAPYALSFANKLPDRIRGDVCLLAPWVGGSESSGYKWLRYIPNGILKTAQAAEWKLQAWMIGKPPTIAWEGIGYDAKEATPDRSFSSDGTPLPVYPSTAEGPRPSMASSFSEYDDLCDFDGRFESRSTLGAAPAEYNGRSGSESKLQVVRKTSRGFLGRLKGSSNSQPQSPTIESPVTGKRLKGLRSMGSLKSKASTSSKKNVPANPQLPPALKFDVGLGLDAVNWNRSFTSDSSSSLYNGQSRISTPEKYPTAGHPANPRAGGRRSLSFNSPSSTLSLPSPNTRSQGASTDPLALNNAYQAALGNALIAASHSESSRGTHNDLLQILNHDNHPWGFSYHSYPHRVRVWYGDKDEKIAENAVRWMEKAMGEDKCSVKVVRGADHGLMYKSAVVIEVLECLLGFWQDNSPSGQ